MNIKDKPKTTWDQLNQQTGLPAEVSQALAVKFIELEREGKTLYTMTLMFGWVPGLMRDGGNGLETLKRRIEVMWEGLQNRLFNRPENKGSFGVVFWDRGEINSRNKGFHAHMIFGLNEQLFKGKFKGTFESYWELESSRWIARATGDPLVRTHLQRFDGNERGIQYCGKSIGGPSGLVLSDVLYLGSPAKQVKR